MSLWSKVLSIFGADPVISGVVVATNHYSAQAPRDGSAQIGTGKQARVVQVPTAPDSESWSVTVRGLDKQGNNVTEEIDVPWNVWCMAKTGDKWPITS